MITIYRKKQNGFTLIELLVVIAIIGILASVVLVSLSSARQKSRDARRLSDMAQIARAFELFYSDCNGYPNKGLDYWNGVNQVLDSSKALYNSSALPSCDSFIGNTPATGTVYLASFPTAPTPVDGNCTSAQNSYRWIGLPPQDGGPYVNSQKYAITFCLGSTTGGYSAGQRTLTEAGIR